MLIRALKPATPRHLGASIGICLLIVILAALTVAPAAASPSPLVDQAPQVIGGPVAAFTITAPTQTSSNLSARVFEPVTFDATASQGAGLAYGWTFGDGTPAVSGQKATHLFDLVDDYQVTLAIASASGATVATTQSLRIVPAVPALVSDPPMQQVAIGAVIPVTLYIRAPGPATITASLTGDLITGKPVEFSTGDALAYASLTGQVANESNPTIDQSIIQTPGSVPLKGNVGVQIAYKTSAGASVEMVYQMDLQKNVSPALGVWSITYPNFSLITGKTDPAQPDLDSYYLKGDPGFHHPDDPLVRRYAMIAARAGGALSDDPARVMENVYSYVTGLLGSDDPAQIDSDTLVAQKISSGILVPGQRAQKYICIGQTYFLSSLSRTLGLPSRELTIALANPVSQSSSGAWTVDYVQEGATEVWYAGSWHLYDTWLKIRQLDDYLVQKYAYQAWYSNSAQSTQLTAKNGDPLGLYGHDFAIGEYEGIPASWNEWNLRASKERSGVTIVDFPTS
ncbi:MAG TPA: PKD domain-containing protein [Dehalococcoidia bacterium]|nr:PKD domain-containing protein [Dehalococcoidia bacterium]